MWTEMSRGTTNWNWSPEMRRGIFHSFPMGITHPLVEIISTKGIEPKNVYFTH